jgi:hypothetical protein
VPRRVTVDPTVLRVSSDPRLVVIGEALSGLGRRWRWLRSRSRVYVLTHAAAPVGLFGLVELGPLVAASLLDGVRQAAGLPP